MRKIIVYAFLPVMFSLFSCDEWIEFSPYENKIKASDRKQNEVNYKRIASDAEKTFEPFKIGLISDTHTYYDEFEKQVGFINSQDDLDFIIHLGDITLSSNIREFQWYSDIVNRINIPVFTLIGNHDCLGNGKDIYKEMFGDNNFSFGYKGVKFILFDDVVWEKQIEDPDFGWLNDALEGNENYNYVIPFAHIPPWDSQFSLGNELLYNGIMEHFNVPVSIHGHGHSYSYDQRYGEVNYLMVPSCIRDELIVLDFQKDTMLVERIKY